jgi:hypothetical protein
MAMTPEMRREVREIVEDVIRRQLHTRFINARSILPQKISPVKFDGTRPANGDPLLYDAANDVVTF